MEWLKKLLGEDSFKSLSEKAPEEIKILDSKFDKEFFPKYRVKEFEDKNKELSELLTNTQTELETLKSEKEKGSSTFEEQVTKLNEKINGLENTLKQKDEAFTLSNKRSKIDEAFRKAGAIDDNNRRLLVREFEDKYPLKDLQLKDDKVDSELINPFKESYKVLFGEIKNGGFPHKVGEDGGAGDYYTMDEMRGMNQAQIRSNLEKVNKSMEFHSKQGN